MRFRHVDSIVTVVAALGAYGDRRAQPRQSADMRTNDVGPETVKAVETPHGVAPDAVGGAQENVNADVRWPDNISTFTPDKQLGVTGVYGAEVCWAAPLVQGSDRLSSIAG